MSNSARICLTCRCFNPYGTYKEMTEEQNGSRKIFEKLRGQCRAHAPSIDPDDISSFTYNCVWPIVPADEWCVEWSPRMHGGGE